MTGHRSRRTTVQRLSAVERARVEAMAAGGVSAAGTAARLGRDPSTIYRDLRCSHLQRPVELARQHGLDVEFPPVAGHFHKERV